MGRRDCPRHGASATNRISSRCTTSRATDRITAEAVEKKLVYEIRKTKSLTEGTRALGIHAHMLPEQPSSIGDDEKFHFAILAPSAASSGRRPSREAERFINETTSADRRRVHRNTVVLVAPSTAGLEVARKNVREQLGWQDVQAQLKAQGDDAARDQMVADLARKAQRMVPEAIRHAWTIVVTVDADSEVKAFRLQLNTEDPLFAAVKNDDRIRIQDQAINTDALLPGGPYDLWRDGEKSRRVKDLGSAFARDPRLPKMLRADEIGNTINDGVENGRFVAGLARPDGSVKTWWRTAVDEDARTDPATGGVPPRPESPLSDLNPKVLRPRSASRAVDRRDHHGRGRHRVLRRRADRDDPGSRLRRAGDHPGLSAGSRGIGNRKRGSPWIALGW